MTKWMLHDCLERPLVKPCKNPNSPTSCTLQCWIRSRPKICFKLFLFLPDKKCFFLNINISVTSTANFILINKSWWKVITVSDQLHIFCYQRKRLKGSVKRKLIQKRFTKKFYKCVAFLVTWVTQVAYCN